jgi:hypothetical protein
MSAFDVYSIYLAVKAHFTTKKYDYFRYGGRTKTSEEKFNKRNDKYFFEKLSKKLTKEEVEQYFVSNFLVNSNFYIKEMDDKNYMNWKKRTQSISYLFLQDLENVLMLCKDLNESLQCKMGQHSTVLKLYLSDIIMIETMILLNRVTGFVNRYDSVMSDDVIWEQVSNRLKKYDPFVKMDTEKVKQLVKQKL